MAAKQIPSILLVAINAKYIHSNLAVHSLAASAKGSKAHVRIAEFTINMTKDQVLEGIYQKHPTVLCFSCYIWNIRFVEAIAREFHKVAPQVPIWVGGPEVSYEVEAFLKSHPYVEGVMIGEGEVTFQELCAHYCTDASRQELQSIHGLAIRSGDAVYFTKPREVSDLSTVPFCYDDMESYENRIIYYESSRGCPFSCSYCLSSVDKKLRFRNLELVKEELTFFLEKKVPQVKFVDRTFNCDHAHAMGIWQFIKEKDNGITNFHFEISADLLTEQEIELLCSMRKGLVQLEIGVQSTHPETIREIHRSMRLDLLKENVAKIKKAGNIHQHLDLIAGLPFEDFATFRKSFDEIFALWTEQLQLGFLKVLKGSFLYEHAEEYEVFYHEDPPYEVLCTKWLSFEEILRIKRVEEQLEVYYNSGQYEATMKVLGTVMLSPFDFFLSLGDFYDQKGYRCKNHTRLRRCEILLEYLQTEAFEKISTVKREEITEIVKESLLHDLYERENCKTRPDWATDPKTYRELAHQICNNGKLSHLEPFHYRFPKENELPTDHLPERTKDPIWVFFDYEKKENRVINPCNHAL